MYCSEHNERISDQEYSILKIHRDIAREGKKYEKVIEKCRHNSYVKDVLEDQNHIETVFNDTVKTFSDLKFSELFQIELSCRTEIARC